jgi:hypothetical protein
MYAYTYFFGYVQLFSLKKREFLEPFLAQYFRLTKTNKCHDFDIFLQIEVQIL